MHHPLILWLMFWKKCFVIRRYTHVRRYFWRILGIYWSIYLIKVTPAETLFLMLKELICNPYGTLLLNILQAKSPWKYDGMNLKHSPRVPLDKRNWLMSHYFWYQLLFISSSWHSYRYYVLIYWQFLYLHLFFSC